MLLGQPQVAIQSRFSGDSGSCERWYNPAAGRPNSYAFAASPG